MPTRAQKAARIRRLMDTEGAAVATGTQGFNAGRYRSTAELTGYEDLKARAREVKEHAVAQLPALIDRLTERVEANGGSVYLADDAADANRHITQLCREQHRPRDDGRTDERANEQPPRVAKSKSMTSEEIEVNEALEGAGVEVVETDLGEWVLQLAGEAPSHLVAPAIHKSREGIAALFNERFEPEEPFETAEELTQFARGRLGELIQDAHVGMTGANFLVAETGTVCLVTSEGNARKTAFVPPTYIAVAGVEKILPRIEDLQPFAELIGRSGTGQDLTSYFSMFTPPFDAPAPDFSTPDAPISSAGAGERSFHLVLIDNGRLRMREDDQLRETLYCIRCGACANSCANFQQVGGHVFGGETYSGGIATGWEAGVHGLESAASFNDLCTGCSRCVPACPVGIDIPWINTVVRSRLSEGREQRALDWLAEGLRPDGPPGADDAGPDLQKRVFARFGELAKWGSRTAPLSNWVSRSRPARAVMERVLGIDRRRALPEFQRETLAKWFARREAPRTGKATREVVLYADAYSNFIRTARGRAAARALEALGCRVHLSEPTESGRAPLSQGRVALAERQARKTAAALGPHLEAGRDVVVIEPTDLSMLKRDYEKLLPAAIAERLAGRSFDAAAYLARLLDDGADPGALRRGGGRAVFYHSHCQQRTLGLEAPTVALLEACGYDVRTSEGIECCGMAGSFGYKREYYELSMKVGERLGAQWAEEERRVPVTSGTSCQEQLEVLSGRPARHVLQLVAPS